MKANQKRKAAGLEPAAGCSSAVALLLQGPRGAGAATGVRACAVVAHTQVGREPSC